MILKVFEAEKADVESMKMAVSQRIVGSHSISRLSLAVLIDLLVFILNAPLPSSLARPPWHA
jgi:hypothetical protein